MDPMLHCNANADCFILVYVTVGYHSNQFCQLNPSFVVPQLTPSVRARWVQSGQATKMLHWRAGVFPHIPPKSKIEGMLTSSELIVSIYIISYTVCTHLTPMCM